jgi:hypothetical protein
MHYLVGDAQNIAVEHAIQHNFEWLLLWEDDVIPPANVFQILNQYMVKAEIPVISGLYFTKGEFSEPIIYRGLGNSYFRDWKLGSKVWVDGIPTGMTLIHMSLLRLMWNESETYETLGKRKIRKVFETPTKVFYDPELRAPFPVRGTSDLAWCRRVIKEKVLTRAGWPKIGRRKYPFLVDTRIFCKHIDLSTGVQYPKGPIDQHFISFGQADKEEKKKKTKRAAG